MQVRGGFRKGVIAGLLLLPSAAIAEEASSPDWGLRSTLADEQTADGNPACGSQAALFIDGAFKVWVTRKGSVRWNNPLRPLSPETLVVLQVAVNGRAGSAFGPDFDNLRQGVPPRENDEGAPEPVKWDGVLGELPREIRVVSEDGRVLLGPMRFHTCGTAPKVAPARSAARIERAPEEPAPVQANPRPQRSERPRLPMPQGAIR